MSLRNLSTRGEVVATPAGAPRTPPEEGRIWRGAVLIAGMLALAGCGDPGAPNGEQQVLFFQPEFSGLVAENLSSSITIPRHMTLGNTPKSIQSIEHYDYKFDGTSLAFPETSGLKVLNTTLDEEGWHITLLCTAPPGAPAQLRVAVQAGPATRYEDSTTVTCVVGRTLEATPFNGAPGVPAGKRFTSPRYVIGGRTNSVTLSLRDDSGRFLFGHGLQSGSVLINPLQQGNDQVSGDYSFTCRQAGPATVIVGGTPFELPFEVVGDDTWSYEIVPLADDGGSPLWGVSARLADGTLLPLAQTCDLIATASDGTPMLNSSGICVSPVLPGHGELCIKTPSKSGCVAY